MMVREEEVSLQLSKVRLHKFPALVDYYVWREIFSPFVFGLFFFLLIFMIDLLMSLIDDFISKGVPFYDVVKFFYYAIPAFLVVVIPMAVLFGVIVGVGRLHSGGEITAMVAGGLSHFRIFMPILVFAVGLMIVDFVVADQVAPRSRKKLAALSYAMTMKKPLPKVANNVFMELQGGRVLYVRSYREKEGKMHQVIMFEKRVRDFPIIVEATYAVTVQDWHLFDGNIRFSDEFGRTKLWGTFEEMILPTQAPKKKVSLSKTAKEMTSAQLRRMIKKYRSLRLDTKYFEVEYYNRFAFPFAVLLMSLLAYSMATAGGRSGSSGVGLSILVIMAYYILMTVGKAAAMSGKLSAFAGAWLPNLVIATVAIFLFLKKKYS